MLFFIGILFSVIGIIALLFRKKFGFIPFLLGGSVIYLVTWGPLKNSKERLQAVLYVEADSILELRINPWNYGGDPSLSLLHRTIRIRDTILIHRLNNALKQGEIISSPPNTTPRWTCEVEIIKENGEIISFGVRRHGSIVLQVTSNGDNGWVYGYIWADSFGHMIDSIASR